MPLLDPSQPELDLKPKEDWPAAPSDSTNALRAPPSLLSLPFVIKKQIFDILAIKKKIRQRQGSFILVATSVPPCNALLICQQLRAELLEDFHDGPNFTLRHTVYPPPVEHRENLEQWSYHFSRIRNLQLYISPELGHDVPGTLEEAINVIIGEARALKTVTIQWSEDLVWSRALSIGTDAYGESSVFLEPLRKLGERFWLESVKDVPEHVISEVLIAEYGRLKVFVRSLNARGKEGNGEIGELVYRGKYVQKSDEEGFGRET
jgi:hypothetical protein